MPFNNANDLDLAANRAANQATIFGFYKVSVGRQLKLSEVIAYRTYF